MSDRFEPGTVIQRDFEGGTCRQWRVEGHTSHGKTIVTSDRGAAVTTWWRPGALPPSHRVVT